MLWSISRLLVSSLPYKAGGIDSSGQASIDAIAPVMTQQEGLQLSIHDSTDISLWVVTWWLAWCCYK